MLIAGLMTFSINQKHLKDKFHNLIVSRFSGKNLQINYIGNLILGCCNLPIINSNNNIVVGRMIRKNNNMPVKAGELEEIFKHGDYNVKNYWGDYVSIIKDQGNKIKIYVSPSGQVPIYYYLDEYHFIFSNQIHLIKDMANKAADFNWNYLAKFLINGNFTTTETPFNSIHEIDPGSLLNVFESKIASRKIWRPTDYLTAKSSTDYSAMAPDILFKILNTWLEPYNTFCLDFSGGLDSTALAFTLDKIIKRSPGKKLIGINAFHPMVNSSNEKKYAKATAEQIDMDLIEFNYEHCLPFTPITFPGRSRNINKPSTLLFNEKYEQEMGALCASFDLSLPISGHGGDSLFMCPPTSSSITDYFIHQGCVGIKTKVLDLCVHLRLPIYQAVKNVVVEWLKYRFKAKDKLLSSQYSCAQWINKSFIDSYDTEVSYEIENYKKCLPGKKEHIISLLDTIANTNVNLRSDKFSTFFPFLQQPLLEMGLSIPTYLSLQEGYDRFLFRKGISRYFQTQSVWRKGKGETSGIAQLGLIANLKHVSELCLDGLMAKNHHIDRNLLLNHLRLIECGQVQYARSLIYLFSIEKFISYWS